MAKIALATALLQDHLLRRLQRQTFHLLFITCLCLISCASLGNGSMVIQAEQLTEEGRYTEAIGTYRKHIQERLDDSTRPEWENPYFYLLRIIDLQLRMERPADALSSCREAEKQGVESILISDRYRAVASWHEQHGNLEAAFEVLKSNRERDPLLFDAMLDRIGRALTAPEKGSTQ